MNGGTEKLLEADFRGENRQEIMHRFITAHPALAGLRPEQTVEIVRLVDYANDVLKAQLRAELKKSRLNDRQIRLLLPMLFS